MFMVVRVLMIGPVSFCCVATRVPTGDSGQT
jgi:hypothetical protein